jgi:hypothetical protein
MAMNRFALTYRGEMANRFLVALLALGCLGTIVLAANQGGAYWLTTLLALGLLAGALMRHPMIYGLVALLALIGLTVALEHADVAAVVVNVGIVVLALYVRSQCLVRVPAPEPPPEAPTNDS